MIMKQNEMQRRLLSWWKNNPSNFPWRKSQDPYKILVSEILLHKTDSRKVENVYPLFINKFPTIHDLNNSEIKEIEYFIKNIGLLYRVKRMKKIAEQIVTKHNGKVPSKREELQELYGVGNYISNAVLCFAYNKRVSIVDTNIIRIYERVFGIKSLKSRPRNDKEIWNFAEKMLPEDNYKEFNYALLDFASEICKSKNPKCSVCIMDDICKFRKKRSTNENKIN